MKTSIPSGEGANFKVGQVQLRFNAGLNTEFVDNIDQASNASSGGGDVIITPSIGVNAVWPMTKLNTLQFRASLGYSKHLNNSSLDRQNVVISPDSEIRFNIYTGDFRISFHDSFSIQNDLVNAGTGNGVAQLPRFTNTFGVEVLWDMNEVVMTAGYDHMTFITIGSASNSQGVVAQDASGLDNSTDQFSASATFKLSSIALAGIEGTWSISSYPSSTGSDFTSISVGPFVELQLTKYTHLFFGGGYRGYSSDGGQPGAVSVTPGTPPPTTTAGGSSQSGYYLNASVVHRLNRYYSDTLAVGHSDSASALSGRTATNFIRYSSSWTVNSRFTLGTSLFFEDVQEITGNAFGGGTPVDYQRYGITLSTGFRLTQHADLSLSYSYMEKLSDVATQEFSQNRFSIGLGYRF